MLNASSVSTVYEIKLYQNMKNFKRENIFSNIETIKKSKFSKDIYILFFCPVLVIYTWQKHLDIVKTQ